MKQILSAAARRSLFSLLINKTTREGGQIRGLGNVERRGEKRYLNLSDRTPN